MRVVTVKAIAKELHERGHYLDELYQITIAYATSLHTRYCAVEAKCEAIEQYYRDEVDLDKYSWEEDDKWIQLDEERSDIEDEMQDLFNTVIGFEYDCNPFKN
ncbi:hypothetical protein [uncultured Veillonella sp.]|uniref:hypothetical protein n=1 Tax=uncultured Veillonella sp. TaxID=159268 RepID=UPI0026036290|nr:hypothetical protein [uncultured Veillonella sp.]